MIYSCPHCGHSLDHKLNDGLGYCDHCNRVFESSNFNKLLSAAWQVRREHISLEQMKWQLKLDEDFSILVYTFVFEHGYTHEDFIKVLKKLGISEKTYM